MQEIVEGTEHGQGKNAFMNYDSLVTIYSRGTLGWTHFSLSENHNIYIFLK